jgi:hypothetical protein
MASSRGVPSIPSASTSLQNRSSCPISRGARSVLSGYDLIQEAGLFAIIGAGEEIRIEQCSHELRGLRGRKSVTIRRGLDYAPTS